MANNSVLKGTVNDYVKQNGAGGITGQGLQTILDSIIDSLGGKYQYAGVAVLTPTPTNPGTPDANVFYIASEPGTYTNFGGIVLTEGEVAVLKGSGSSWTKEVTGIASAEEVSQLGQELNKIGINSKNNAGNDLIIEDENGNVCAKIYDGELKTKNFDSKHSPKIQDGDSNIDLSITDDNGKEIARFQEGGIITKSFNSLVLPKNFVSYKGKKVSILGDSISTFGTPDSRNEDGTYCYSYYPNQSCRYSELGNVTESGVVYDSIKFNVQDTWWMKLIYALGANLGINDSYRGTTITDARGNYYSLSNQYRISHLGENGTPDLILVYGGTNDAGVGVTLGNFDTTPPPTSAADIAALGNTTFAEAVRTMLVRLMFTYPNAEIVVILPTLTIGYYTIQALDSYVEVLKEACDFFGIRYIDIRTCGINYYNQSQYFVDGVHPNIKGMELIYRNIYKQLIF